MISVSVSLLHSIVAFFLASVVYQRKETVYVNTRLRTCAKRRGYAQAGLINSLKLGTIYVLST